ncbi:substrate-binding domain-containing protein [Vibrio salinus]|uniref:substrate-binding domain-containing protein n=1 Tax=Vibrio salinus TaxID=2899784 RepID=UPI001E402FD8|nr:substrate-binding domain-containing protein [Vibrio salinus]MCE0495683.1 substrate-binding domain-containing protein [Vibrio salinus]
MATIKDVAKEAGVSVTTASRVINKAQYTSETAVKAVNAAMEKLGYRPNINAQALVTKSSNTIGVIVNDVSSPFFGAMVKAIDVVAIEHKKRLLIGNGYHNAGKEREAINLLLDSHCESLVVHSKGLHDEELIELAGKIPGMVLINRNVVGIESRCIALDNYRGSYMATEYLIRNGHKHIGYLCSSHSIDDAYDRKSGYIAALKDNGIEPEEEYIAYGEPDEQGGELAMSNLIAKNMPVTAVAAYNDYMAAGGMVMLQENGINIPEEMSIVGFDDGYIASCIYPRLTTIKYPIQVMAQEAVKLSLSLVSNKPLHHRVNNLFMPILIRRSSVSCIS